MAIEAHTFNTNEVWTLAIAAYAAIVSTFVLGWDAYKWLASGARVELSLSTDMILLGGAARDDRKYISATALNVGDRPTTITNLGGLYYASWWSAYGPRRRSAKAFIITQPSDSQRIPYRFEVGDQWIGLMEQNEDVLQMARDGYLFIVLYTTQGRKGQRVRLRVPPEA